MQLKGLPVEQIMKRFYPVMYCGYIYDLSGDLSSKNLVLDPDVSAEAAVENSEKYTAPAMQLLLFDKQSTVCEEDIFKAFFNGCEIDTKAYPEYVQDADNSQNKEDQGKTIDI